MRRALWQGCGRLPAPRCSRLDTKQCRVRQRYFAKLLSHSSLPELCTALGQLVDTAGKGKPMGVGKDPCLFLKSRLEMVV